MVLSEFLRKRKRERSLRTPRSTAPTRDRVARRRRLSVPSFPRMPMSSITSNRTPIDCKVSVDKYVAESMQLETEALLRNQNPCSVYALATALSQSGRSVMILYEGDLAEEETQGETEEDEDDKQESSVDDVGLATIMKRWKTFSLGSSSARNKQTSAETPSDLKRALFTLECSLGSGSNKITSWEEARAVLSTVIQFPDDETATPDTEPATASSSGTDDVEEYRKRLKQATQAKDIDVHFEKSREQWKQVAESRIPTMLATSDEPALVDDQAPSRDAASITDQLLSEKIAQAYEERDRIARGEAVQEVQERADEAAREEEATELAASLLRPLSDDERQIVDAAIFGQGPPGEILSQVGTDSVQRQSVHCLQNGEWLNDEVIHYFYVMLAKRDEELCRLDPSRKRSHFFKSFFITKLLNEGHATKDGQYEYSNVKRWSKKVPGKDIFKLDKIFFPVNQGRMHWMCAVVNMTEKRIEMYDSMGSDGMKYLKTLFRYIQDEHMAKKGAPLPDMDEWELVGFQPGTPCQHNGFDCGVFTCMFADFLSRDWPLVFTQHHITQCRERIALSIMKGSAIM